MAEDEWRIGILFSRTGVTADAEISEANAALLATEEINDAGGISGRRINPIFYDPGCSINRYRELAVKLLAEDKVRIIFGCYMSSERKTVLREVESRGGLLFYPTFYEGFEYSTRCFYGGASANQNAIALARYLVANYGARLLLVGSNYVFPREYNRVVTDLVEGVGGSILDEIYVPVEATSKNFARVIKRVRTLSPDAIVSTVVGVGSELLYQAYHDAGFNSETMPIASLTMTEAEVVKVRPEHVAGHLTSASFFETQDSPQARRFVSAFKKRFGQQAPITASAEATYCQVHLYAKALELAGSDQPDAIAKHLRGQEFDAPQGKIRIDPHNHHTELWSRIAKIDEKGLFNIIWESEARIRPDPYFVSSSYEKWSPSALAKCTAGQG